VRRGEAREDLLILRGAGCRALGEGVEWGDDGGEEGTAGEGDIFIARLSRLSSATSSIRDSRFRCRVGEGDRGETGLSVSQSLVLAGRTPTLKVSIGLLDLDLDIDRTCDNRASNRSLAALRLAIASVTAVDICVTYNSGRLMTVGWRPAFCPLSESDKE
jgi:hypothetical protein